MAKSTSDRLDSAHFEQVIALLNPTDSTKPISKKDACGILGIAYNTTRLTSLIEKYLENKARDAAKRAALRGKPATASETVYIIQEYLGGATIDSISKTTYRGTTFIKNILGINNVPTRAVSQDYFKPELIPEGASRSRFMVGDVVYSARYDSTAVVDAEYIKEAGTVYRLWLLAEKWQQYCYQPPEELASLEHLRALGVKV